MDDLEAGGEQAARNGRECSPSRQPAGSTRPAGTVALLCPEARLRRILRLALQADGIEVVDWGEAGPPTIRQVAAVVVDLDSLGARPAAALAALRAAGLRETTALLLISVYPPEPLLVRRDGALDYLQPPFGPAEFARRVADLLNRGQ